MRDAVANRIRAVLVLTLALSGILIAPEFLLAQNLGFIVDNGAGAVKVIDLAQRRRRYDLDEAKPHQHVGYRLPSNR